MASTAIASLLAAAKATQPPQSAADLETVLNDLPRRELQALGKAHGVAASLKRASLVAKLRVVLSALLWPARYDNETPAQPKAGDETVDTDNQAAANVGEEKAATADEHAAEPSETEKTPKTTTTEETATVTAAADPTAKPAEVAVKKTTTKTITAAATTTTKAAVVVAVGKRTAASSKRGANGAALSPGKLKKATPVKATAVTPSRALDKIHAKQVARQMTLQEHEQAKRQRAALLLSGFKYSAVKKTRSKTKQAEEANAKSNEASITKTLSFGASTPANKPRAATTNMTTPARAAASTSAVTSKETASAKKARAYKPYVGPLPAYDGDSLFTPKKSKPRPAPMAVAVMKAARTTAVTKPTTPSAFKKPAVTENQSAPAKKAPTPTKQPVETTNKVTLTRPAATLTKKSAAKDVAAADKENAPVSENTTAQPQDKTTTARAAVTKKASSAVAKARISVKTATSTAITHQAKRQERRDKFMQESKAKSAVTRRQARTTASNGSVKNEVATKKTTTIQTPTASA